MAEKVRRRWHGSGKNRGVNLPNVIMFFGTGFLMELLPRLAPQWVADDPAGLFADTSALWLTVMGAVMMAVGGAYLVRMAWETLPWERYEATLRAILDEEKRADMPAADVGTKPTTRVRG